MKPHTVRERLWLLESRARLKQQLEEAKTNMALMTDQIESLKAELKKLQNS